MAANPFHDLYLSEAIGSNRFVELFSPEFVKHALSLFEPGNVVLRGLQGSGKTMLLNLLKPEIRIAYQQEGREFPVPLANAKFLAAGINLRKSGIMDFGQLIDKEATPRDLQEYALQFADFVNYWLVADLLQTILKLYEHGDESLLASVGLATSRPDLDAFARRASADACWFGYFKGVKDFNDWLGRINERVLLYRRLINLNIPDVPEDVTNTKTVIGNPLVKVVDALRAQRVVDGDTELYVRIDQYEQLPTLNVENQSFGTLCQELIHKALAARDSRISYRVATRHYAWPDAPRVFGTNDSLEHKRDYSRIDIDERLRRKENRATWIFPAFAEDIFVRRLRGTDYAKLVTRSTLNSVFGAGLTPEEKASRYANRDSRTTALQLEDGWSESWRRYLIDQASGSALDGKLAVAHFRQKAKGNIHRLPPPPQGDDDRPWFTREYWRKERIDQALLQIASANRQQPIWCGKNDVLGLSGGNILVFLSLCQHVWDVWARANRNKPIHALKTPIDAIQQSQGLLEASEEWLKKQTEGYDATRRRRFVRTLGQHLYGDLTEDKAMSYPGHSGFSVNNDELERSPEVQSFLRLCVDFGDLYEAPHTSKTKGEKRTKFYLAPVLTPNFKIPYQHVKEPKYVKVGQIAEWISSHAAQGGNQQLTLWDSPST